MPQSVLDRLLTDLPDAPVRSVLIGTHWTAVVAEQDGQRRCGLATSLDSDDDHHHSGAHDIPDAGRLHLATARELAQLVHSPRPPEVSVGMAAINALLPPQEDAWVELNAQDVIIQHGAGKHVALVGHFPFVPALRPQVGRLSVLELEPQGDDLPADAAPRIIPQADVVAITSLTLLNRTFEPLVRLCQPGALVLLLGPTTPLTPLLFDYGVDILSGSVVHKIDPVLNAIAQGGNFRQVHRAGVRLVTMRR